MHCTRTGKYGICIGITISQEIPTGTYIGFWVQCLCFLKVLKTSFWGQKPALCVFGALIRRYGRYLHAFPKEIQKKIWPIEWRSESAKMGRKNRKIFSILENFFPTPVSILSSTLGEKDRVLEDDLEALNILLAGGQTTCCGNAGHNARLKFLNKNIWMYT